MRVSDSLFNPVAGILISWFNNEHNIYQEIDIFNLKETQINNTCLYVPPLSMQQNFCISSATVPSISTF